MPTKTQPLPDKLQRDLRKSRPDHMRAFVAMMDQALSRHPDSKVGSTKRYSAFYKFRHIAFYIDPQKDRILFGFFRDFIPEGLKKVSLKFTSFPTWSEGSGGLVGYALGAAGADLSKQAEDIEKLIDESYWWR